MNVVRDAYEVDDEDEGGALVDEGAVCFPVEVDVLLEHF